MGYFQRLLVNTLTFVSLSVIFPNMIYVRSLWMAVIAAVVLSILNLLVKPILTLFSFPLTLLTLGLFSFVVNGIILKLTSFFVGEVNFGFSSFGAALLMAVIMSFVNTVVSERNLNKEQDQTG